MIGCWDGRREERSLVVTVYQNEAIAGRPVGRIAWARAFFYACKNKAMGQWSQLEHEMPFLTIQSRQT